MLIFNCDLHIILSFYDSAEAMCLDHVKKQIYRLLTHRISVFLLQWEHSGKLRTSESTIFDSFRCIIEWNDAERTTINARYIFKKLKLPNTQIEIMVWRASQRFPKIFILLVVDSAIKRDLVLRGKSNSGSDPISGETEENAANAATSHRS